MSKLFKRPSAKVLLVHGCLLLAAFQFAACSSRQERAENYYKSGVSYLEKHEYAKARVELKNALQLKGDMVQAWRALAQVDEHEKQWSAVAGSLKRIVELDPKDAESRLRLARLYLLGGAVDNALTTVNAAVALEPKNASALALKAAVLFRLKDVDGATREAEHALKIDPGNAGASVVLASRDVSKKDYDSALKVLDGVKSEQKNGLGVVLLKVNIFNRIGKLDEVEALMRRLIKQYPKQVTFQTQLIRFYVAHKRFDDAVKELRAVIEANPKDLNAEFQLVNLLARIKGPDEARAELVSRIKAGGRVLPYQLALARFDYLRGKDADGVKMLDDIISSSRTPEDVLAAKVTLADLYMTRNNSAAAEPLVKEILVADSRNIDGLRLRAAIRFNRGQYDEAIEDLRQALNDQPKSAQLLASLGAVYERSGKIELASDAYLEATKASAYDPRYGLKYVAFLRRRGLNTQAANVLAEVASRNPNSRAVLSALAKEKLTQKDWAGAHAIADQIRKLGEERDALLADQIQGAAFGGEEKYSDSLAALQNVYDAVPQAVQPMVSMVTTYMRAKQPEKAEEFLQAALKKNPDNAEALVLMGTLRLVGKKPDEAATYFKSAIEKKPKSAVGYRALADLYARQGKLDEALETTRAGLKEQPKSFTLGLALAGLLEAKQEYEPAIAEYERILKDQPGSLVVINNLASLLADHRTDKASLDKAELLAVSLKKVDIPQFKDTLGWITYRRGDYPAAVKLLEEAESKLSKLPLVSYHLGVAYLAVNENKKAMDQFKNAQELAPNDAKLKAMIDAAIKAHQDKKQGKQPEANGSGPG